MSISIISLLVVLFVFCVIWYAATRIMAAFGVGDPVRTIVQVVLVVLAALWLLNALGVGTGIRLR